MIRIAVNGAAGRMGGRILALAAASKQHEVVAAFDSPRCASLGRSLRDLHGLERGGRVVLSRLSPAALGPADVLIDFSSPEGTDAAIGACLASKTALVVGTTGLDSKGLARVLRASSRIPVLHSANMSVGVNVLLELVRRATASLGKEFGFDIEITEAHHRLKKDAPSGTAKKLAEVVARQMGWRLDAVSRYGRRGITGERPKNELGIHVIRSGDIVGDHTVSYGGPGEVIELTHRATSRDVFARGALAAARFLSGRPKGLYTMADALGLNER